jgi:hypothetical protein
METARTMFRASLIHLPALMACMLLHRRPQHGDGMDLHTAVHRLLATAADAVRAAERALLPARGHSADGAGAGGHSPAAGPSAPVRVDAVPFPLMPLPMFPSMSCPSRVMAEDGEKRRR